MEKINWNYVYNKNLVNIKYYTIFEKIVFYSKFVTV